MIGKSAAQSELPPESLSCCVGNFLVSVGIKESLVNKKYHGGPLELKLQMVECKLWQCHHELVSMTAG